MKTTLTIVATLLFVALVVMGIIIFGPFRDLLPQGTRAAVDQTIPDYFSTNTRPPVVSGGGATASDEPSTATTQVSNASASWKLLGSTSGTSVAVLPFGHGTSTGSTPPEDNMLLVPQTDTGAYSIQYFARDQSFMVALVSEPLGEARKAAERNLIQILGINEIQACNLRYAVTVPAWVNPLYTSKNLGFSFCPGATPL